MYTVACKDLGLEGCSYTAEGESIRKLQDHMLLHFRDEHPEMIRGITDERHRELERMMEERAVSSAA